MGKKSENKRFSLSVCRKNLFLQLINGILPVRETYAAATSWRLSYRELPMISYPNCDPGTKQNRTRGTATRKVWAVVPSVLRLSQTWGEQGNVSTPYLYIYVYTILYTKTKKLKA